MNSYEVIPHSSETLVVMAESVDKQDDDLFFFDRYGQKIAWFNTKDLVGFTLIHVYGEVTKE